MKTPLVALLVVLGVWCSSLAWGQSSPPASQSTPNASESEPLKPYHLVKTIPLPFLKKMMGQLGLDQESSRLFFSDGKDLTVINAIDGERIGLIPKIGNVSDIAFAPGIQRAFIVDSYSRNLFVLDLSTLTLVEKANIGTESSSVLYDSGEKEIFMTGTESSTCKVFNAVGGKQVAAVKLRGYPLRAVNDSHGHIYFELTPNQPTLPSLYMPGTYIGPLKTEIAELDTHTLEMSDHWSEASCPHMGLMGVDRSGQDLVISCQNSVALMDPQTRKMVASQAVVEVKPNAPVTFSTALGDAFFEGLDDQHRLNLAIVHEDSRSHLGPAVLAPQVLGRPTSFDEATQHLFVVQSESKIVDTGFFLAPAPGTSRTPLRVPEPIPGTYQILIYSRN